MRLSVVAAVVLGMLLGCAGVKERVEPRQALWNEAGRFVYPRPVEQVWPEVERFLAEQGFSGRKVEGQYVLLTEYKEYFQESRIASGFVRYYVDARALSPVSCEVRILRHGMFTGGKGKQSGKEQLDPERLVRKVAGAPDAYDPINGLTPGNEDPASKHFARTFSRDLQMEWALLQRLEPAAAQALEQRYGPKAAAPQPPAAPGEESAQTALASSTGTEDEEVRGKLETLGSVMDVIPPASARIAALERAQCNRNNPWTCHLIAYDYETGHGKGKDAGVAAALHEFACLHRHWGACARLGVAYALARGVPRSDAKAAVLYQAACDFDSVGGACQNLGWLYAMGAGVPRDDERADKYFRRACDEGVREGCRNARKLDTYRAEERRLRELLRANRAFAVLPPGTAGSVGAQLQQCTRETRWQCNAWGVEYSDGKARAAEPAVAAAFFEQACALGEAASCHNLTGLVLAEGRALHSSLLQPLLAEGCERGEAPACTALGLRTLRSDEQKDAHARALRLFGRACELRDAVGCTNLGWMHERGEGTPRDAARAARLYAQACEAGVALACRNLAVLHARGEGVAQDWALAAQAYGRACDAGDGTACLSLASLHAAGYGVPKDRARSVALYDAACVAGKPIACVNLGFMYQAGLGVMADNAQAAQLYERACLAGHAQACSFAANLFENGTGLDASRAPALYARACSLGQQDACGAKR